MHNKNNATVEPKTNYQNDCAGNTGDSLRVPDECTSNTHYCWSQDRNARDAKVIGA